MINHTSYKDSLNAILERKNLIGGIAILSVVLYHTNIPLFYIGFIGVDFFFFFSGYSLSYSMKKHSIGKFYRRRLKRILPMFLFMSAVISLIYIIKGQTLSIIDWLCNMSSLSYYKVGGQFTDWYLCSLFIFYLTYPLLFRLSYLKCYPSLCYLSFILVIILFSVYDIDWIYGCAIGRVPIFMLGILCYRELTNKKRDSWYVVFLSLTLSFVYLAIYMSHKSALPTFGLIYFLAPATLIMLGFFLSHLNNEQKHWVQNVTEYCGVHSLEIYVSNVIAMKIMGCFSYNTLVISLAMYFIFTLFISYFTIRIQSLVNKIIT